MFICIFIYSFKTSHNTFNIVIASLSPFVMLGGLAEQLHNCAEAQWQQHSKPQAQSKPSPL